LTVEQVEAQWQHRVSQKDRAHAAAEQALRDENDALRRQNTALSQPRSQSNGQSATGDSAETETLRQELERQRQATEEERRLRQLDSRKAKYPALAANVGEAGIDVFAVQDEATLARLNAQLEDGSSVGTFAPTAPRRPAPQVGKDMADMSKAEIEAEMRRSIERGDLKRS
jgi:capsule polysaccharide export protein KpsE/RkpR